jgi:polysaccharide pyruvyl transferase WcaK-like protein
MALAASALGKPVMLYAAGVYPPRTTAFKEMLGLTLRRASVITVRDEFSAAALKGAGTKREVTLTADPAITLRPPLWPSLPHDIAAPTIGVSLRPWYHLPTCPAGKHERLVKDLAASLDAVVEATNGRLLLLPMQHGGTDDDLRMQKRVLARMARLDSISTYSSRRPFDVLGAIAGCDLVIGMRLHSNVFAAAAGVPSIGLAYDPKVGAFMKSLGFEDHVIELDDLHPETLADRATLVLRAREPLVHRLEEGRRRLVELAWECATTAVRLAGAQPLPAIGPSGNEEESTRVA